jgi:gliding motility-associated lipoprotein GldH
MRLTLFILGLTLLSACGPDFKYEQFYELEAERWEYADSLQFEFQIEDTLEIYNLYIELEHSPDFRNQNLYTRIHTRFPQGESIQELLSLELIDKNTGSWRGKCGSERCRVRIPIQQGAYFNQAGVYQIVIEQYMRQDSIPGIYGLGFQLEATGESRQ